MAKFNIFTGNLSGGPLASVYEHALWIENGLRELGHDVTRDDKIIYPDRENIFFEWFVPGQPGGIQEKFLEFMVGPARSYPYTIVVTEKCNGGSFNQSKTGHFGTHVRWQRFTRVARRARRLWTFVPEDRSPLSFVCPRVGHLELGYCKALEDFGAEHTVDFALFGSGTEERAKLVQELRSRGHSVAYPAKILEWREKEKGQRAARVVLSPRIWGWFPMPSGSRPARVMHTDSACAVELCPNMTRPPVFCPYNAEGQSFADFAVEVLGNYRPLAARATERYRTEMPGIAGCIEACLDASGGAEYRKS